MTPTQLRNSILQTAITGALVPQNPDEGSAEQLLQQIEDEKRRLIAERNAAKIAAARAAGKSETEIKKIKLEKYTAPKPVNPEDASFEIPKSWRWVRLGNIFMHSSGKQLSGTNANSKGTFHKYITTSNLYWGRFELDNLKQMKFTDEELERCTATYGDLLVCEGGDIGRSAIWNYDYDICLQNHVHKLRPYFSDYTLYIFYVMMYYKGVNMIGGKGIGIQGLSANALKNIQLPLPPLSEQHRIVAKLEELLSLVEEYGEAQTELEVLNAALPDKLKKSLLQQAITGRLVPQDPADGSAEQLLNNIIREKQRQIKAGIIKLSKPEMKVAKTKIEEEFDIPNTWKWCLLADVCRVFGRIGFRGYTKTDLVYSMEQGAISISPTNMVDSKMSYEKCTYISEEKYLESPEIMLKNGDVLIVKTGSSFGKTVFVSDLPWKATINPQLAIIKDIQIDTKYLVYVLQSPYAQRKYLDFVTGSAIPTFSQEALLGMSIPLPPLPEQRRIVAKLEEMFAEIEKLR
ncbi:MAG: restriction endonuclease subunit S [Bacteroidales bacterium]|nr:restriction endonuclease subunit S [Bacteroidales bacterium]